MEEERSALEVVFRGRHYRVEPAPGGAWRVFRKRKGGLIEVHGLEAFRAARAVLGGRVRRPSPRARRAPKRRR